MKNNFLQMLVTAYLVFLASLVVITGVGFVICSLFFYLCIHLTTWGAALATGCVVLVAMLIVLLSTWLAWSLKHPKTATPAPVTDPDFSDVSGLLQTLLKNSDLKPREICMYAVVAGGILGASPELRRLAFSLITEATTTKPPQSARDE